MIGFCFLTFDDIERTDVWNEYFKNVSTSEFEIFVNPKKSNLINHNNLFKTKIIPTPYTNTEWGTFSLLIAQDRLLREAYKNSKIQHFVILSHNTIPVKKFKKFKNFLNDKKSIFSYEITNNNDHLVRYGTIKNPRFDKNQLLCQDQWCILSRTDVSILLNGFDDIKDIFGKMLIPDEHVYINYLIYYRNVNNIHNSKLTHIVWENCSPKVFKNVNSTDIPEDCYFLRKVDKNTNINISF
jgi:hypothetical protein